MSKKKDYRVIAILDSDANGVVRLLGRGTYVGDEIPDDDAGALAEMCRVFGWKNPKIVLDNGKVAWGGECWWGPEKKMQAYLDNATKIIEVDIDEIRKSRE